MNNSRYPSSTPDIAQWRSVRVRVPATCANLGPGFDCLALALDFANTFEVRDLTPACGHPSPRREGTVGQVQWRGTWPPPPAPPPCAGEGSQTPAAKTPHPAAPLLAGAGGGGEVSLELSGAEADLAHLSPERDNLFWQAFCALYTHLALPVPLCRVRIEVCLPPGCGLGSSATAVVGGLLAANTLLGEPLCRDDLLDLAVACEPGHHADNVAAALLGGLVVTGARNCNERMIALSLPVPEALQAVLFIPDQPMSTVHGRSLLPAQYPRQDVTFNLSRVALLLGALQTGRFDLLATAMEDCVHQHYREQLFPALSPLIAAGVAAGAHGVCLSGGGSSVLALVTEGAATVAAALEDEARARGVGGHSRILAIAQAGANATLFESPAEDGGEIEEVAQ